MEHISHSDHPLQRQGKGSDSLISHSWRGIHKAQAVGTHSSKFSHLHSPIRKATSKPGLCGFFFPCLQTLFNYCAGPCARCQGGMRPLEEPFVFEKLEAVVKTAKTSMITLIQVCTNVVDKSQGTVKNQRLLSHMERSSHFTSVAISSYWGMKTVNGLKQAKSESPDFII